MKRLMRLLVLNADGLIPAIIQDRKTKEALTLCYMNRDALRKSFQSGYVYVFRRSKGKLMMKGQSSGCVQRIKSVSVDCEGKSLLIIVDQVRAACHEGYFTCYFRRIDAKGRLSVRGRRIFDPKKVYAR